MIKALKKKLGLLIRNTGECNINIKIKSIIKIV
jgi:hypothetical protein